MINVCMIGQFGVSCFYDSQLDNGICQKFGDWMNTTNKLVLTVIDGCGLGIIQPESHCNHPKTQRAHQDETGIYTVYDIFIHFLWLYIKQNYNGYNNMSYGCIYLW